MTDFKFIIFSVLKCDMDSLFHLKIELLAPNVIDCETGLVEFKSNRGELSSTRLPVRLVDYFQLTQILSQRFLTITIPQLISKHSSCDIESLRLVNALKHTREC